MREIPGPSASNDGRATAPELISCEKENKTIVLAFWDLIALANSGASVGSDRTPSGLCNVSSGSQYNADEMVD
jgi:hypothetical protein